MSEIATEQVAANVGGSSETILPTEGCTKERALTLGCEVISEYEDKELVTVDDLEPALKLEYFIFTYRGSDLNGDTRSQELTLKYEGVIRYYVDIDDGAYTTEIDSDTIDSSNLVFKGSGSDEDHIVKIGVPVEDIIEDSEFYLRYKNLNDVGDAYGTMDLTPCKHLESSMSFKIETYNIYNKTDFSYFENLSLVNEEFTIIQDNSESTSGGIEAVDYSGFSSLETITGVFNISVNSNYIETTNPTIGFPVLNMIYNLDLNITGIKDATDIDIIPSLNIISGNYNINLTYHDDIESVSINPRSNGAVSGDTSIICNNIRDSVVTIGGDYSQSVYLYVEDNGEDYACDVILNNGIGISGDFTMKFAGVCNQYYIRGNDYYINSDNILIDFTECTNIIYSDIEDIGLDGTNSCKIDYTNTYCSFVNLKKVSGDNIFLNAYQGVGDSLNFENSVIDHIDVSGCVIEHITQSSDDYTNLYCDMSNVDVKRFTCRNSYTQTIDLDGNIELESIDIADNNYLTEVIFPNNWTGSTDWS